MPEVLQPEQAETGEFLSSLPCPELKTGDHLFLPQGLGNKEFRIIASDEMMDFEKGDITYTQFQLIWARLDAQKQSLIIQMNRKLDEVE